MMYKSKYFHEFVKFRVGNVIFLYNIHLQVIYPSLHHMFHPGCFYPHINFCVCRQFCMELNGLAVKLQMECNPETCTQMTATEQWIFLCAAHKTPKEVRFLTKSIRSGLPHHVFPLFFLLEIISGLPADLKNLKKTKIWLLT